MGPQGELSPGGYGCETSPDQAAAAKAEMHRISEGQLRNKQ